MADAVRSATNNFQSPALAPAEPAPAEDLAELSLATPAAVAQPADLARLDLRASGIFNAFTSSIRPPLPLSRTDEPAPASLARHALELSLLDAPEIPTRQTSGSWLEALMNAPETARSLGQPVVGGLESPMGSPARPVRQSSGNLLEALLRAPARPMRQPLVGGLELPMDSPLRLTRQGSGSMLDLLTPLSLVRQPSGNGAASDMNAPPRPLHRPHESGFPLSSAPSHLRRQHSGSRHDALLAPSPARQASGDSATAASAAKGSPVRPSLQSSGHRYETPTGSPARPAAQSSGSKAVSSKGSPARPPEPPRSGFVTPHTTPPRKPLIPTPDEVRKFQGKINKISPDRPFGSRERIAFADCLAALEQLADTPERRARATHTERVMEQVFNTAVPKIGTLYPPQDGSAMAPGPAAEWDPYEDTGDDDTGEEKGSPLHIHTGPRGRRCVGVRGDSQVDVISGSWPKRVLDELRNLRLDCEHRSPEEDLCWVVNLEHALRPSLASKVAVGFHLLCAENEELAGTCGLKEIGANPYTSVWAGVYTLPGSKGPKVSTFFPRSIDNSAKLLDILISGEIIAQEENRRLMRIPGQTYHVELYLRGSLVWSCFPALYYATFDEDASYRITDSILLEDSAVVLAYGQAAAMAGKIMYRVGDDLIIDIAGQIPDCPVHSGVYIVFPKYLIP